MAHCFINNSKKESMPSNSWTPPAYKLHSGSHVRISIPVSTQIAPRLCTVSELTFHLNALFLGLPPPTAGTVPRTAQLREGLKRRWTAINQRKEELARSLLTLHTSAAFSPPNCHLKVSTSQLPQSQKSIYVCLFTAPQWSCYSSNYLLHVNIASSYLSIS